MHVRSDVRERSSAGLPAIPDPPFPVWPWELLWSPDGKAIAAVNDMRDAAGGFVVWNATDGSVRFGDPIKVPHSASFTPDGAELLVATMKVDASPEGGEVTFRRHSTESGELIDAVVIDGLRGDGNVFAIKFIGYSEDGSTLYLIDRPRRADATLVAMDLDRLEVVRTQPGLTDGGVKSSAISPDRSLIATGDLQGYVRIWDAVTFDLLQEIFVADTPMQGLAFVTDDHLAVAPEVGNILVYTLDVEELISLARLSLSRGFTPEECEKYNFGVDCPTLEEPFPRRTAPRG